MWKVYRQCSVNSADRLSQHAVTHGWQYFKSFVHFPYKPAGVQFFFKRLTVLCYTPKPLMWDLMCPVAGIWQATGATAGLQRSPMRNWSDSHSRVNHFHKLITLEEKNEHGWNWEASVQSVRARSVPREHHYLPTDGSQKLLRVCCCLWISLTLNKTPTHCSLRYCIMHY